MANYSTEFKIAVVLQYLLGDVEVKAIAQKYGLENSMVRRGLIYMQPMGKLIW